MASGGIAQLVADVRANTPTTGAPALPPEAIAGQVLVYAITACRHCKAAKEALTRLRLPWVQVNLDEHPERRVEMNQRTERLTVPQIFFNELHVGGNSELQEEVRA